MLVVTVAIDLMWGALVKGDRGRGCEVFGENLARLLPAGEGRVRQVEADVVGRGGLPSLGRLLLLTLLGGADGDADDASDERDDDYGDEKLGGRVASGRLAKVLQSRVELVQMPGWGRGEGPAPSSCL